MIENLLFLFGLIALFTWKLLSGRRTEQKTEKAVTSTTPPPSILEKIKSRMSKFGDWLLSKVMEVLRFVWQPALGLTLCHLLIWRAWPEIYGQLVLNEWFWWNHVVIFVVFTFLRKDDKSIMLFGKVALLVLIIADVTVAGGLTLWQKTFVDTGQTFASGPSVVPQVAELVFPEIPQDNPVAVATEKFWKENLSELDAAEMIAIAEKESAFTQFEADGVSPYRGKENNQDVGVMQINEGLWLTKAKELGFDIHTLEGNLKMALWIRERNGASEWVTKSAVGVKPLPVYGQTQTVVVAPVGTYGEKIPTPGTTSTLAEGPIWIRPDGDDSRAVKSYKDAKFITGRASFLQYQSRTTEPVKVTVSK